MTLNNRIDAFLKLGEFLSQFDNHQNFSNSIQSKNDVYFEKLLGIIHAAQHKNGWFLPDQVIHAIKQWATLLTKESLLKWTRKYEIENIKPKTVAVVMAGNIPLVGFHDLLSILISGHRALIKIASNNVGLIPFLCDFLISVAPEFSDYIVFTKGNLKNFDAVIATGSNNTARYFEYYFSSKPNIIRKNRKSVAVLTGEETPKELAALGEDIFRYFGLGCRSVSKLFVPQNYNFDAFFKAMYAFKTLLKLEKYTNNYDYNKAVYLMSNFKLLDNGFLMLKEDESYSSPISSVFYEFYEDYDSLKALFGQKTEQLQCIVNYPESIKNVNFGETQRPSLSDYADGIDTVDFLLKI